MEKSLISCVLSCRLLLLPIVMLGLCRAMFAQEDPQAIAKDILQRAQISGGLIVHLGCGSGELTAALRSNERFAVHGLETDPTLVHRAREHVRSLGLYGPVSIARLESQQLPYAKDLVNLLVAEDLGEVPRSEIMRVLAPRGVACVKQKGEWKTIVKPWPEAIDEWTHFLHGPDNNAVARDRAVDVPRSLRWVAGPRWGRSHEEMASMSAAVTAGGKIYYIIDEAPLASIRFLGNWKLVARDAFNGMLLWKRPISSWNDHLRHFRSGPTHLPRRLVASGNRVYATLDLAGPVVALDGATGSCCIAMREPSILRRSSSPKACCTWSWERPRSTGEGEGCPSAASRPRAVPGTSWRPKQIPAGNGGGRI